MASALLLLAGCSSASSSDDVLHVPSPKPFAGSAVIDCVSEVWVNDKRFTAIMRIEPRRSGGAQVGYRGDCGYPSTDPVDLVTVPGLDSDVVMAEPSGDDWFVYMDSQAFDDVGNDITQLPAALQALIPFDERREWQCVRPTADELLMCDVIGQIK